MSPEERLFHAKLRSVKGNFEDDYLISLAFIFSVISPVRTKEMFFIDVDIEKCNWMHIFSLANSWLVAPLLLTRIHQKQLESYCPKDFLDALGAFHEANVERNLYHKSILLEALSVLNNVGITPMLLKGAHALLDKMPDAKERIISDIDLLVPLEQINTAHNSLLNKGFYHEPLPDYAIEDLNLNTTRHQLRPLFHPNGRGYIELHRFPNYSQHYPNLIAECFVPEKMLFVRENGVAYYYNYPWQLLIYNQVHHYHSAIALKGMPDIRHLAEQSVLLAELNDKELLDEQVKAIFTNEASRSYLQFALMDTLFGHEIPKNLAITSRIEQKYYQETLAMLLGNQWVIRRRKAQFIFGLLANIFKPQWLKKRILNFNWYRSRPQVLRKILNS